MGAKLDGAGVNVLTGGAGNDTIHGGLGNDRLYGGPGNGVFVFDTAFDTALGLFNRDSIYAYVASDDSIHLDNAIFRGLLQEGGRAPGASYQGKTAHDADDRIISKNLNGQLIYDADGAGGQAGVVFATLVGVSGAINAGEFMSSGSDRRQALKARRQMLARLFFSCDRATAFRPEHLESLRAAPCL